MHVGTWVKKNAGNQAESPRTWLFRCPIPFQNEGPSGQVAVPEGPRGLCLPTRLLTVIFSVAPVAWAYSTPLGRALITLHYFPLSSRFCTEITRKFAHGSATDPTISLRAERRIRGGFKRRILPRQAVDQSQIFHRKSRQRRDKDRKGQANLTKSKTEDYPESPEPPLEFRLPRPTDVRGFSACFASFAVQTHYLGSTAMSGINRRWLEGWDARNLGRRAEALLGRLPGDTDATKSPCVVGVNQMSLRPRRHGQPSSSPRPESI